MLSRTNLASCRVAHRGEASVRSTAYQRRVCSQIPRSQRIRPCAAEESNSVTDTRSRLLSVPENPNQQVAQAAAAIEAAWKDGISTQSLELLLPIIGATELDDWPGGIRQQFRAASPLVSSIVNNLRRVPGLEGRVVSTVWDDGDAVGAWTSDTIGLVLFPTADVMAQLRTLTGRRSAALTIIVNPQWSLSGLLINDFGFGMGRKDKEVFVDGFKPTYSLKTQRIYGDSIRIFKSYPGPWQITVIDKDGKSELLATSETQPTYTEVEAALKVRPSSAMNKSWVTRLQDEFKWNKDSLQSK